MGKPGDSQGRIRDVPHPLNGPEAPVKAAARPLYYARTRRWPDSNAACRTMNHRLSSIPDRGVMEAPAGMDGPYFP